MNLQFLEWLEGEEDRLPRLHAVRQLKGEEFAAAIRAAAWLRQLSCQPDIIAPLLPGDWESRYKVLESFLCSALSWSMTTAMLNLNEDLVVLEHVLDTLLPKSSWEKYRADFLSLRKKGQPLRLPRGTGRRRSGGKERSEQTDRMRAAVAYVATVSNSPYADLSAYWNECLTTVYDPKYDPQGIRSRLRKGHYLNRTPGTAKRLLEYWKMIYDLDFREVFPGPFPPSRELEELWQVRTGQKA